MYQSEPFLAGLGSHVVLCNLVFVSTYIIAKRGKYPRHAKASDVKNGRLFLEALPA